MSANMGVYGQNLQVARRRSTIALSAFPVNTTAIYYVLTVPSGMGKVRVEAVNWVASAALADSDGVMTVAVTARDVSEGADDAIVSATTVEGGTAHVVNAFTLATEGTEKEFTLDEGDTIRVIFVNDSAAINTNGAITVEVIWYPIPDYTQQSFVNHPSAYSA